MPISEWQRQARRKHLGSSDAPAVVGISPYRTPVDVYWEKVEGKDEPATDVMEAGRRLENVILDWATSQLGLSVRRNQYRVSKGADRGVLAANFDALGKGFCIEAKYTTRPEYWGEEGTDQVPDYVALQVQHQMYVGELDKAYVAVMIAGVFPQWKLYEVPRSEKIIKWLVEQELQFWHEHILKRIPPEGGPPPMWVLKQIGRKKERTELGCEALSDLESLERVQQDMKRLKAQEDLLKRRLIEALGEYEEGVLPDGRILRFAEESAGRRIDSKKLKQELPEVWEKYSQQTTRKVFRVLGGLKHG